MGDSMSNNINKHGLSKTDDINIINISGLTSSDVIDHVNNPSIKMKPEVIMSRGN